MNPRKLSARNLRVFSKLDIELPDGCIALVGTNGAGKSTIAGLPDLALFGPEARTFSGDLSRGASGMSLEMIFDHSGTKYRVARSYSEAGRGKTTLDFEHRDDREEWQPLTAETIAATQARIESTVGLTRRTYRASSYLSQGGGSFAQPSWDPAARKRLLFEALSLTAWERLGKMAKTDARELELRATEITGKLSALQEQSDRLDSLRAEYQEAHEHCANILPSLERAKIALLDSSAEKIEDPEPHRRALLDLERSLASLKAKLAALGEEIHSLCDRCGQQISSSEAIALATRSYEAEMAPIREQIATRRALVEALELRLESGDAVTASQLKLLEEEVTFTQDAYQSALDRLNRLDAQIEIVQQDAEDTDSLRLELTLLTRRIAILGILAEDFSVNGVPAYILEAIAIPAIERETNSILESLGTPFQIELRTLAERRDGDGLKDTLDVVIHEGADSRPYETFSGGEQSRLNVALQIGLALMLRQLSGASSETLIVDEPEYLDQQGTAALASVLRELVSRKIFSRVILVSHSPGLSDAFDTIISVEIEHDGSRRIAT